MSYLIDGCCTLNVLVVVENKNKHCEQYRSNQLSELLVVEDCSIVSIFSQLNKQNKKNTKNKYNISRGLIRTLDNKLILVNKATTITHCPQSRSIH